MTILGVDVGTTGLKMGVFRVEEGSLEMIQSFSKSYPIHTYNDGLFSDIDPEIWQEAFVASYRNLRDFVGDVNVTGDESMATGMPSTRPSSCWTNGLDRRRNISLTRSVWRH